MTIIDKQPNESPAMTDIPDDVPYPKGVLVYRDGEAYLVSERFIRYFAVHYEQEDAVRELDLRGEL